MIEIEAGEHRSWQQLRDAYTVEKELADRLRVAGREERAAMYASVYDEWCRRVPRNPMLARKAAPAERERHVRKQMMFIGRFLRDGLTFLEIGPGDCALAFAVAKVARRVYGVDVSGELTGGSARPPNFELAIAQGNDIPLPPGSVDVAYSNQLMEHLHPDDAEEQVRSVYRSLARGGVYMCLTPNRITGPHDISKYFDEVATGFHLKEYTNAELSRLLKAAGFRSVRKYVGAAGVFVRFPLALAVGCERLVERLPRRLRRRVGLSLPLRPVLDIRMIAQK